MMDERNNENSPNEQGRYNPPEQNGGYSSPNGSSSYGGGYGQYSYNPYGRANDPNANNRMNNGGQQEYSWRFEDYESNGRRDISRKKSNTCLIVIGLLLAVIFFVGVVCLAGYGIYTMLEVTDSDDSITSSYVSGDNAESESVSHSLAIKEHAQIETTASPDGRLSSVEIAKKVRPSVVGIAQYNSNDPFSPSGQGSGIIVNEEGYIVTNAHVVQNSNAISVELENGESYYAKLVGIDSKTDLAVIKIEAEGLVPAEFGDSGTLEVGETVIAIGNPGGQLLAGSVTQGIVSAVDRNIKSDGVSSTYIQTDAAINPGNSGGALVNQFGQVIGINSSKIASVEYEGIGFAIPIKEAKPIIDSLMTNGYVAGRCKLGITGVEINEALSQMNGIPKGIYIHSVERTSDLAGKNISPGDIILEIDGQKIETFDEISEFLTTKLPGDVVSIKLYRSARGAIDNGKTFTVEAKLMEDVERVQ